VQDELVGALAWTQTCPDRGSTARRAAPFGGQLRGQLCAPA
jgi:hypothetical protein